MKTRHHVLLLLLAGSLCLWPVHDIFSQTSKRRRAFIPEKGKVLLIVGQDIHSIDQYVKETGSVPGGFAVYTSIQRMEGLNRKSDGGGGVQYANYLLKKYPDTVLQVGLYMVGALEGIYAGRYDTNIDHIGNWIKKTKRPVYLRIGYEFDHPGNNYSPPKYIKAFRYIVNRMEQNNVNNVAFVWHSHAGKINRPVTSWYPGDQYVDWVGVSFFHKENMPFLRKLAAFAKRHKKPFMFAESTPFNTGVILGKVSWKEWFDPFFDFIKKNDVRVACYINCDWETLRMFKDQGWGDARVQADPYIKEKWLEETGQPMYLKSSPNLFKKLK